MVKEAFNRVGNNYNGPRYLEYEPYYVDTDSTVMRSSAIRQTLLSGGVSGVAQMNIIDEATDVQTMGITAPPKNGN